MQAADVGRSTIDRVHVRSYIMGLIEWWYVGASLADGELGARVDLALSFVCMHSDRYGRWGLSI